LVATAPCTDPVSIEVGKIKRIEKNAERKHDNQKIIFKRQIQLETALTVFRS
jgi:hypothetical protein